MSTSAKAGFETEDAAFRERVLPLAWWLRRLAFDQVDATDPSPPLCSAASILTASVVCDDMGVKSGESGWGLEWGHGGKRPVVGGSWRNGRRTTSEWRDQFARSSDFDETRSELTRVQASERSQSLAYPLRKA